MAVRTAATTAIAQWSAHINRFKGSSQRSFFGQDICPNIYTQAGRDTNADTKSRSIPAVRLISAAFDILSTHKLPGTGLIPLSTILRALFMGQAKIWGAAAPEDRHPSSVRRFDSWKRTSFLVFFLGLKLLDGLYYWRSLVSPPSRYLWNTFVRFFYNYR